MDVAAEWRCGVSEKIRLADDVDCPTHAEMAAWCEARGWRSLADKRCAYVEAPNGLRYDQPFDVVGWRTLITMFACQFDMSPAAVAREMTAGRNAKPLGCSCMTVRCDSCLVSER